jgi:hypothetical protein
MEPKLFLRKGVFYGNDNLIFGEEIYLFLLHFINYKMLLNDPKSTCNSFSINPLIFQLMHLLYTL